MIAGLNHYPPHLHITGYFVFEGNGETKVISFNEPTPLYVVNTKLNVLESAKLMVFRIKWLHNVPLRDLTKPLQKLDHDLAVFKAKQNRFDPQFDVWCANHTYNIKLPKFVKVSHRIWNFQFLARHYWKPHTYFTVDASVLKRSGFALDILNHKFFFYRKI